MNSISLSELTGQIQAVIRQNFSNTIWVRAEISEIRENSNGHCYLELIEKDSSGKLIQKTVTSKNKLRWLEVNAKTVGDYTFFFVCDYGK